MKTSLTITVDGDVRDKAKEIIERDMRSTLSYEINQLLKRIIKQRGKGK